MWSLNLPVKRKKNIILKKQNVFFENIKNCIATCRVINKVVHIKKNGRVFCQVKVRADHIIGITRFKQCQITWPCYKTQVIQHVI